MSRFCPFSNLTFHDLSRAQMTSDPKNSKRLISSSVSAFQKHSGWKKSKKSFSKPFSSTTSTDRNGRKPKLPHFYLSSNSCSTVHAPHAPQSTFHIPHSTFHIPHSTLHIPHSTPHIPHSSLLIPQFYGFINKLPLETSLVWVWYIVDWRTK